MVINYVKDGFKGESQDQVDGEIRSGVVALVVRSFTPHLSLTLLLLLCHHI